MKRFNVTVWGHDLCQQLVECPLCLIFFSNSSTSGAIVGINMRTYWTGGSHTTNLPPNAPKSLAQHCMRSILLLSYFVELHL